MNKKVWIIYFLQYIYIFAIMDSIESLVISQLRKARWALPVARAMYHPGRTIVGIIFLIIISIFVARRTSGGLKVVSGISSTLLFIALFGFIFIRYTPFPLPIPAAVYYTLAIMKGLEEAEALFPGTTLDDLLAEMEQTGSAI
jgi:hypothetical protein